MLTDLLREDFRDLLGRVADFCGIEVLTFCFMENHFHLLVRVPGAIGEFDDTELLRRARQLYGKQRGRQPLSFAGIRSILETGAEADKAAMRELLRGRMGSLPMFMKILKQRFAIQYNRARDRTGTLWEGPYRSVLVEPTHRALSVVGAYIDLNPVRAGIVGDPKDFRFSGYGEAVGRGKPQDHILLRQLEIVAAGGVRVADADKKSGIADPSLKAAAATYRSLMYDEAFRCGNAAMRVNPEEGSRKWAKKGRLSVPQLLRCRVRYFTDGTVIGSKKYIESWLQASGRTRKTAPKKMRGADWGGLCSLRDLRKNLFG